MSGPIGGLHCAAVTSEDWDDDSDDAAQAFDLRGKFIGSVRDLRKHYANGHRDFTDARFQESIINDGADFTGIDLSRASFSGGNLAEIVLENAKLDRIGFIGTNLRGADLSGASMVKSGCLMAYFREATLVDADMSGSSFDMADFTYADLENASLKYGDFTETRFVKTELGSGVRSARFDGAGFGQTIFVDVDLGPICRSVSVKHHAASSVDIWSIIRSVYEPRLPNFLRDAGMPQVFVDYTIDCARSLSPDAIYSLMQSCFISYGGPDEAFAEHLHHALQAKGVRTFFFPVHAKPGQKLHRTMKNGVNEHDRVILVCSEHSLVRPGVLNEIEETLTREARQGGYECLIPIALDRFVFSDAWGVDRPDIRQAIRDRVIADFSNVWDGEVIGEKFPAQLGRLVQALRKRRP